MSYFCDSCGKKITDENQMFCNECGSQLRLTETQKKSPFINTQKEHQSKRFERDVLDLIHYQNTIIMEYESTDLKIESENPENINCQFKMDFEKWEMQFIPPKNKKQNNLKSPFSIEFKDITAYESKLPNGYGISFNKFDWIIIKNRQYALTLTDILNEIIEYNKEHHKENFKWKEAWEPYAILRGEKFVVGFKITDKRQKMVNLKFDFKEKRIVPCFEKAIMSFGMKVSQEYHYESIPFKDIIKYEIDDRHFKIFYKEPYPNNNFLGILDFKVSDLSIEEKQYIATLKEFLYATIEYNKRHHKENYERELLTYGEYVNKRKKQQKNRSFSDFENSKKDYEFKYCFECGAKLVEENQKFCIKCGADLSAEKKDMMIIPNQNMMMRNTFPVNPIKPVIEIINHMKTSMTIKVPVTVKRKDLLFMMNPSVCQEPILMAMK